MIKIRLISELDKLDIRISLFEFGAPNKSACGKTFKLGLIIGG